MKKYLVAVLTLALFACDKVDNPYQPQVKSELDSTLYPADWSTYPMPVFTPNTNTLRNILLEDYTGHTCVFCPSAADIAVKLEDTIHPGRVLVASIHASPGGMGDFQQTESPDFTHDFTNPQGLEYGLTFQNGFGFSGNPRGTVSRVGTTAMFVNPTVWTQKVADLIAANDLKVNLQAKANYFDQTRGLFLHTEIDPKAVSPSQIKLVVYFIEDSLVAPQKRQYPSGSTVIVTDYVHRDIHRGCIDGEAFGRELTTNYKRADGLYQVDISYRIPDQYNPQNCHLLVYAMNKDTYEVYQVIEVEIP